MATSRIKGITVEIDGDTTGLSKALSSVNKEMKSTLRFGRSKTEVHWTSWTPAEGCGGGFVLWWAVECVIFDERVLDSTFNLRMLMVEWLSGFGCIS